MMGISMWELLLVGLVLFLVVGPSKLPGLAKQIGEGLRDFRRSLNDLKGNVSPDDEFVKAVREARQSVAEAKEAVRAIFDDDDAPVPVGQPDDLHPGAIGSGPRKRAPRGSRALVRPAPPADGHDAVPAVAEGAVDSAAADPDALVPDAEATVETDLLGEPGGRRSATEPAAGAPPGAAGVPQRAEETANAAPEPPSDSPATGNPKRRLVRPAPPPDGAPNPDEGA